MDAFVGPVAGVGEPVVGTEDTVVDAYQLPVVVRLVGDLMS